MAMGMSYEQYWQGPPWLARAYREAFEIKRKQEEWARWRQGAYVFNAIMCTAPVIKPFVKDAKPGNYPDEPWPITEAEAREQEERREKENYERYLAKMNADSERELKRRREAAKKQEVNGNGDD
jgi:hypothetical protein